MRPSLEARAPAPPHWKRLNVKPVVRPPGSPPPDRDPYGVGTRRHEPVGQRLGQRAEHDAGQEMADQVAGGHRGRLQAVEDRAGRRRHVHRAESPVVVGNVGVDGRLHREGRVGMGVVEDHVDAPDALRRRTGEVDEDVLVVDGHLRLDQDRSAVETVAPRLVPVNPVGYLADGAPHRLLGPADDLVGERIDGVEVELVHEAEQGPGAHVVAGSLGVEIAHGLVGGAHVGPDDGDQVLVDGAAVVQLHDRDPETLLVDLAGLGGEDPSPDVGGVAGVGEVGHLSALLEDRRHHRYVVLSGRRSSTDRW